MNAAAPASTFVGCFKDDIAARALPNKMQIVGSTMTLDACATAAAAAGYRYYGVEYATGKFFFQKEISTHSSRLWQARQACPAENAPLGDAPSQADHPEGLSTVNP